MYADVDAREPKPRAWHTGAPPDIMIVVLPKKLAAVDLGIFAYEIVLVSWSAHAILRSPKCLPSLGPAGWA